MTISPLVFGKYQLLTRLAKSGLGEVWKARSHGVEGFEKILVIKRIAHELSEHDLFVERFIEEAKVAVTLTHANIVQVFDLGLVDDTYFIAMEYVRGLDLGVVLSYCKRKGVAVPEALAIYIVSELAKGLDYAHRRRDAELVALRLVHSDVAPENVLLSDEGEVKLTDFGMAQARASVCSIAELPSEKYAYLSPEQVREEPLDSRTDIYALGVVLHEILTGQRVLDSDAPRERAREIFERTRRGERLDLVVEGVGPSPALQAIIARATSPVREQRQANAGELYEELMGLLYESGRRVGALELARWLEELSSGLSPEPAQPSLGPFSGMEEIFSDLPTGGTTRVPRRGPVLMVIDELDSLAPRAEWRDVSVLYVDGQEVAPLAPVAARYGGDVLRIGESAVLVFGLGEASGRDAHAAARCGLRLLRLHANAGLRITQHSGNLLLDAHGEALDDASKQALLDELKRWSKRAHKGELLATPSAAALLRSRFELLEQGHGAQRLLRELGPGEGVGKFVGRRDELRTIGEVFARANRTKLCVLGLRGDAGMGKSRLVLEIERRLRHAGHDVGIYTAPCSPQGKAIPYFALQEIVRAVVGLEDLDSPAKVQEQIDRLRLLGLSAEQRDAFARLLGVNTAEPAQSSKLQTGLVRMVYKLAQDKLSVFVWDGAEFMDTASCELVYKLLASPLAARVLVIFAYRPGKPLPFSTLPDYTEVTLGPLADEDVARLVRHRLGATEVQLELVRAVTLKTGGNPLFVEELVTALRENGAIELEQGVARLAQKSAASIELPRTLRGLVASRVGKLSVAHRLILQLAVTFGPRFSPDLLARASGLDQITVNQALAHLGERELVRTVGPREYAFAHELVREVLYAAISLEERPVLHAAVARAIETLLPVELEAAVERLAFHYREAGEWEAAMRFLVRAAQRFEAEYALEAAIEVYTQALELTSHAPSPDREAVLRLHARIGELAFHTRESEAIADRMGVAIELAESWGAAEYVARFAMLRGRLLNKASRFREGRLWLERANTVARNLGHGALEREIALAAAEAHARNGEYRTVVQYVGDALAVARVAEDRAAEVRGLILIIPAHAALGEIQQAREALGQLEALVDAEPDRNVAVELERIRSIVLETAGEYAKAREVARRALDLAKEYDFQYEVALSAYRLGGLCLRAHQDKRAFAALRLSYGVATEHGYTRLQWRNVCMMGFLDAMRFDSEQGYLRMQQAVRYAEERAYALDLIEDKYLLAMVEQKRGDVAAARALLRAVVELADTHGHVRACEQVDQALRALADARPIELPR